MTGTDDRGNNLLDAVDALTKPLRSKVMQGDVMSTVELPCLLEQLESSIYGSVVNNGGGGSSPAQERNVIDADAMFVFVKMNSAIGDWCRIEGLVASRKAVPDLRDWYIAHVTKLAHDDRFYVAELWKWAYTIRARLDPVRKMEVTEPCPLCGASEYTDENGSALKFPVLIEWRESAGEGPLDQLERASGTCRACAAVWEGNRGLRDLRFRLDAVSALGTARQGDAA